MEKIQESISKDLEELKNKYTETNSRAWGTGKTQRDRVERELGGGIRMGNTPKCMADSCQCMTRPTIIL